MNKKCIYISGKVTGLPFNEVVKRFAQAATKLQERGWVVCDPVWHIINHDMRSYPYRDIMNKCINYLSQCDAIYMLKDWKDSNGARCEYFFAKGCKMEVFFE
jgi:hypothetical protein